jgi:O-antigen ligase
MSYTKVPVGGAGDSAGVVLLVFSILSLLLAAITIALRIWVRDMKETPLAVSDWLLLVAWVSSISSVLSHSTVVISSFHWALLSQLLFVCLHSSISAKNRFNSEQL